MKTNLIKLTIFTALLVGSQIASAREFYKITSSLSLTYTSLKTGTRPLVSSVQAEIRFSDDSKFCQAYILGLQLDCAITYSSSYSFEGYLIKAAWMRVFAQFEAEGLMDHIYNDKIQRILEMSKEGNFYIAKDRSFSYQIDDAEPEAFHLYVSDITDPVKL